MRSGIVAWVVVASACSSPVGESTLATTGDVTTGADATTLDSGGSDTTTGGAEATTSGDVTPPPVAIEPMVVMTFNVLCALCTGEFDPWDDRVAYMADTIERHAPDLIGLQEVLTAEEVEQIRGSLATEYATLFYTTRVGDYADALILYRPDRFEPIEHGFYWLSPTPDTPFSTGFADGFQLARLVVWARMTDLPSGQEILFATTHFDNNSPSQELSAPLLLERTAMLGGGELPTVVVGDFNARPDEPAYEILTQGENGRGFHFDDVFDLARTWSIASNERPAPVYDPAGRIDHIFVAGAPWQSTWWTVDIHAYGESGMYVSDHFAMAAELSASDVLR